MSTAENSQIYPDITEAGFYNSGLNKDDVQLEEISERNGGAAGVIRASESEQRRDVEKGDQGVNNEGVTAKEKAQAILAELRGDLTYAIEDVPPWYTCLLLGFQHYLTMFGATLAIPLLLAEQLCIKQNLVAQAELIGTIFTVSGIATLLQSMFGVRLPIVQGGTFAFIAPVFAILGAQPDCPVIPTTLAPVAFTAAGNATTIDFNLTFVSTMAMIPNYTTAMAMSENLTTTMAIGLTNSTTMAMSEVNTTTMALGLNNTMGQNFTTTMLTDRNYATSMSGSKDYTTTMATQAVSTESVTDDVTPEPIDETEFWQQRMRKVQGAIMVASIVEVIIGFTGIIGVMLRFIGPLTIAPTITLIGLSLFEAASNFSSGHWGIAALTIALMALFSQYIARFQIPCVGFSKDKGCHKLKFPLFKMFPVILSVLVAWAFCGILTAVGAFPEADVEGTYGYAARTDIRLKVLSESAWIRIPYPGQWGVPSVEFSGVIGVLAGVIASIFESVGDYYACARLAGAPPPPVHAINRGIGMEGIGCILAGAFGTGTGTTSYGENIGALGITKVGSRRAIQYGASLMILLGLFAKFGALFVTIPDPIIGGMFCIMFGMVAAVGISNLQFVNLNSSRNLFVIGFPLIMGFIVPYWVSQNEKFIATGSEELNQIIKVLLKTNMFVGGVLGFILDNTLPGSDEDRGIAQWKSKYTANNEDSAMNEELLRSYQFPFGMSWIRRVNFFRYLPPCPTFAGWGCSRRFSLRLNKRQEPRLDDEGTNF